MTRYELPPVEDSELWELWLSIFYLPAVVTAEEFHLFEALCERDATCDQVAAQHDFDRRATRALLDLLAALGLLTYDGVTYGLAPLARTYLLSDSPYCWTPLLGSVKHMGFIRPLQTALVRALQRRGMPGQPAQAWANGKIDPALAATISRIMHCHSLSAAIGVATHGGFESVRRVLDVGGGSGCFSIALAQRHGELRCTIMELATVCDVAKRYIADGGVDERVDTIAVDMFRESWPTGYDAILLSNVFHDWDAARNAELSARAFAALPASGRICIHERLLEDSRPSSPTTAAFSMLMLLTNEGRQYQLAEVRELLTRTGFTAVEVRPTYGGYSLVTGIKP